MRKFFQKESLKLKSAFYHPSFVYLILIGNSILFFSTVIVYYLEREVNPHLKTYFDSLWWGVSTITTVGFGDVVPITFPGRVIAILLMYSGTVLFIMFTGMWVTLWLKGEVQKEIFPLEKGLVREEKEQGEILKLLKEMSERLERLEKR